MFQRALLVLFFIVSYGVGKADQLTPSSPPETSQVQNTIPSKAAEVVLPIAVKKPDEKSEVVKPAEPKPLENQVNKSHGSQCVVPATAPIIEATTQTPTTSSSIPLPVPVQASVVPAVELLPHRATYSITLDKNYYDQDIAEAKGQMTIQLAKIGDGWSIEQKSTLQIYYKDETAEQVITSLATYESMDGLKYSFNARTLRGDQEDTISGEAILASKGGAGIVTYQEPDESEIQLPIGTIFPTQHLIYMLEAAIKGKKVVSNVVFDGSSETHEPVLVDTFLGAGVEPKLALTNKDLLQSKKVWPMRMAIYAVDSNGPEADYEICQHVLDHGVIRDMTLDYGTFKVKAVLNQVEVFS